MNWDIHLSIAQSFIRPVFPKCAPVHSSVHRFFLLCTEIFMTSENIFSIGIYSVLSYFQNCSFYNFQRVLRYCMYSIYQGRRVGWGIGEDAPPKNNKINLSKTFQLWLWYNLGLKLLMRLWKFSFSFSGRIWAQKSSWWEN